MGTAEDRGAATQEVLARMARKSKASDEVPTGRDLYDYFDRLANEQTARGDADALDPVMAAWAVLQKPPASPQTVGLTQFGSPDWVLFTKRLPCHNPRAPVSNRWKLHTIPEVYKLWQQAGKQAKEDGQQVPKNPVALLVKAWQERPRQVALDTRPQAIFQQALSAPWSNGIAPAILERDRHDNALDRGMIGGGQQLALPGLERDDPLTVHPALMLAHDAGLGALSPGQGARLDKRFLVMCLLALPMDEIKAGCQKFTLFPTMQELIDWFWPVSPRTRKTNWRPSRHAPLLRRAMTAMSDKAGILLPDGRETFPVIVRTHPNFRDRQSQCEVEVKLPPGKIGGPLVDRPALIASGTHSDMGFDAELVLSCMWDKAKRRHRNAKGQGQRIYATRPAFRRDDAGCLLDAKGQRILRKDGKPAKWSKRAVPTGQVERNPAMDKLPWLDRHDRRRLGYGRQSDLDTRSNRSHKANRVDARLMQLARQGRIALEDETGKAVKLVDRQGRALKPTNKLPWRIAEAYRKGK